MPRPKVHPDKRQRTAQACTLCRASKKRCSGVVPCGHCVRRGRACSCTMPQPESNSISAGSATQKRPSSDITRSLSPEAPTKTHPRMLRNLRGERVYIGGAASLSFLQFIRETVVQYAGPSSFTHNAKVDNMLENASVAIEEPLVNENSVTPDERIALLGSYRLATSGILDVISTSEAISLLEQATTADNGVGSSRLALADLILSIGMQCPKATAVPTHREHFFFSRGQKRAFAGMLEDPNLELVWAFLLMAFYMLGACRRNAGFMYLGVAARAAVALGLHHEDAYSNLNPADRQKRLKTWMSLCVLDLLVSSILGRPSATTSLRSELGNELVSAIQGEARSTVRLRAAYEITELMDSVANEIYGQKTVSTDVAEQFLQRLDNWSKALPGSMRTASSDLSCIDDQEHTLGSIQVVCFYYFATMLSTRPFLISTLTARLVRSQREETSETSTPTGREDPTHFRLASACVDSATYLIQACQDAQKADLLLANMCILKALVFAAALVLGFSIFAKNKSSPEIESAFAAAKEILGIFSSLSAQAAHYFEILTFLSYAIDEQRQRLALHPKSNKNVYVGRIFSLAPPENHPVTQGRGEQTDINQTTSSSTSPFAVEGSEGLTENWEDSSLISPISASDLIGESFFGWDSLHLPIWDNFPFTDASNIVPGD